MNFNDLYMEYCKEQTDAPDIFHKVLAYLILASVVNRNISMPFGYRRLYPNLYVLIVAPSSLHRKSWSQGIAVHLIQSVKPEYLLHEYSSRASFISDLASPERDGCGLLEIDELAGFMSRVKYSHHFDGFLQDLSSAYDNKPLIRRKGVSEKEKEIFTISNPCLNMTACCSNDWLNKSLESSDITGGGFARFLWAVCDKKVLSPWPTPKQHDLGKFLELQHKLIRIKEYVGDISFDEDTAVLYQNWYKDFRTKNQGDKWDQNYERITVIAKKLSMLNCLARYEAEDRSISEPLIISKIDLGSALFLAEESASFLKRIVVGDSKEEVLQNKVLHFIQTRHPASKSMILNGIRGLNSWHLKNILETLLQSELIYSEETVSGNHKVTEIYYPVVR